MDLRLSVALLVWIFLVGTALFPLLRRGPVSRLVWTTTFGVFAATLVIALPLWRLRSLLYNGEINVDESQVLSQALKYLADPLPWRSVVGGSSGPLNTWILLWAPLFGLKLGYLAARITSLLCAFATLIGCALALKEIAGPRLALVLTLPAASLLLFTVDSEFVHFSSEQFPATLCAWTVYLLAQQRHSSSRFRSFLIGLLAGSFPFTKLQVAPAGILLFLLGAVLPLKAHTASPNLKRSALLAQCLGGLTVPTLILGPVALAGAWGEFMDFYIGYGLSYSSPGPSVPTLDFLFRTTADFTAFLTVLVTASAGCILLQTLRRPKAFFAQANLLDGAVFLSIFGIHLYGVLRAGMGFPHYLLLLVVPATIACGWFCVGLLPDPAPSPSTPKPANAPVPKAATDSNDSRAKVSHPEKRMKSQSSTPSQANLEIDATDSRLKSGLAVSAVLLLLFQFRTTATIYSQNEHLLASWGQERSPIADALVKIAKPVDSMFIWGWCPSLYVFSQIRPATRFAVVCPTAEQQPENDPALRAILSDVKASLPEFFVDAPDEFVLPGMAMGSQPRHHLIPELSHLVLSEYTLIGSLQTRPASRPILIYRKNIGKAPLRDRRSVRENRDGGRSKRGED